MGNHRPSQPSQNTSRSQSVVSDPPSHSRSGSGGPRGLRRHILLLSGGGGRPVASVPEGYAVDRYGADLGRGDDVFERARVAIWAFAMYPTRWTSIVTLGEKPTPAPGLVFASVIHHLGIWSVNPGRVIETVDQEGCAGFSFGTPARPLRARRRALSSSARSRWHRPLRSPGVLPPVGAPRAIGGAGCPGATAALRPGRQAGNARLGCGSRIVCPALVGPELVPKSASALPSP